MSPAPIQRPVFWPRKEKHSTRQRLEADFNVKRLDETASRHGRNVLVLLCNFMVFHCYAKQSNKTKVKYE